MGTNVPTEGNEKEKNNELNVAAINTEQLLIILRCFLVYQMMTAIL